VLTLDLSKMVVNALIVPLSVVLYTMEVLQESVDIICDNDARVSWMVAFPIMLAQRVPFRRVWSLDWNKWMVHYHEGCSC
jgi:hypothetical protein